MDIGRRWTLLTEYQNLHNWPRKSQKRALDLVAQGYGCLYLALSYLTQVKAVATVQHITDQTCPFPLGHVTLIMKEGHACQRCGQWNERYVIRTREEADIPRQAGL